ncbi:MAG: molybdopterin-binding protein [Bacillota bacterium]
MKISYARTEDSVGKVLSHDVTRIVKGKYKGPAFKKGHIIREQDVSFLLDIGKEHVSFLELEEDELHEDEAGLAIAHAAAGEGLNFKGPSEGKVDLIAKYDGLLKVDVEGLRQVNQLSNVVMASLHTNSPVKKGEAIAGTRVIPLAVNRKTIDKAKEICRNYAPLIKIFSFKSCKLGVVITGREVYEGRIEDAFAPALKEKASSFGLEEPEIHYAPDDPEVIASKIQLLLDKSHDLVVITGGMSVDPDDVTPSGIRASGARVEKYGAPVLPGAMLLLAYHGTVPVVGVPACGMFFRTTVFDLIFPRLLAGEKITALDLAVLGHGGYCRRCDTCTFPDCSFGK